MTNTVAKVTPQDNWAIVSRLKKSERFGPHVEINLFGQDKVCSFDCSYCNLGKTHMKMNQLRKSYEFISLATVVAEISKEFRQLDLTAEVKSIVISGNGEPTLYPDLQEVMIEIIKLRNSRFPQAKIVVLTNGAKLVERKTVDILKKADQVILKMDTGYEDLFKKINNPLVRTNLTQIIKHSRQLKDVIVESFFVAGTLQNATDEHLDEWLEVVGLIKPKTVHLMTMVEDAWFPGLKRVEESRLYYISQLLERKKGIKSQVFTSK